MSQAERTQSTLAVTAGDHFQPNRAAWRDSVFLGVLLLAMCSQINIGDIGQDTTKEGYVTKQLKIALPDIALLLNFGWFIARTTLLRAWKKLWWPPLPCWALIVAMLLAFVHSDAIWSKAGAAVEEINGGLGAQLKAVLKDKGTFQSIKEAIAEIIQYGLYFLVAPWLFVNLIHDRRQTPFIERRRFALGMFAVAIGIVIAIAISQLETLGKEPPRAGFGSPNMYAAFCALAVPLAVAFLIRDSRRFWIVLFSVAILVAIMASTLVSLWAEVALFAALLMLAFLVRAPRAAQEQSDLTGRNILSPSLIALAIVLSISFHSPFAKLANQRVEFTQLQSATQPVKKQFIEWYAAQSVAVPRRRAFATGVGPGNYQINIGEYYASLPNEEKMPPDSNNLYLVQTVSIGFLGLGALLWVVFHFGHLAWRARKSFADDWLASAVLASLGAWLLVNLFHAMIVRGAGVVLAFVLSLAVVAARLNWRDQSTLSAPTEENFDERAAQPRV